MTDGDVVSSKQDLPQAGDEGGEVAVETGAIRVDAPNPLPREPSPWDWLRAKLFGRVLPAGRTPITTPNRPPYSAVALLRYYRDIHQDPQRATGFFIKPDVVVTSKHNFVASRPVAIGIHPAYDARRNPSTALNALGFALHPSREIAVLIASGTAPHFGFGPPSGDDVAVAGYAFQYLNYDDQMSMGSGKCDLNGLRLSYRIPIDGGDSGAPVFTQGGVVVAVNTGTFVDPETGKYRGYGEAVDAGFAKWIDTLEAQARANQRQKT